MRPSDLADPSGAWDPCPALRCYTAGVGHRFDPTWDALLEWLAEVDATVLHAEQDRAEEWVEFGDAVSLAAFGPATGADRCALAWYAEHGLAVLEQRAADPQARGEMQQDRLMHLCQAGRWLHLDLRGPPAQPGEVVVAASSPDAALHLHALLTRLDLSAGCSATPCGSGINRVERSGPDP